MPRTILLKNVPKSAHSKWKKRAGKAGMSLNNYLLLKVREIIERPMDAESMIRIARIKSKRNAAAKRKEQ